LNGLCRAAELDILVTDLERANQRAAAAEKETEKMQHMASDTYSATEQDKVKQIRAVVPIEGIVLIMGISEIEITFR
jgi:hypothetical protein